MKRLCKVLAALLLTTLGLIAAPSSQPATNLQMSGADNQVKSGATLTIKSGGTFTIEGGGTITGVQATNAILTALIGQTTAANKLTYWDGVADANTIDFSPVSQTFLGYTTAAAWRNAIFPTTAAEGDIITHDGTNWIRKAIGTTGQVPVVQLDGTWAWDDFAVAVTAADVTYDNTASGLTAEDVQAAIDEIDALLPTGAIVGTSDTQTLTNKSIAGSQLTGAYTASGMTMATARLLGRNTASTGAAEEITLGTNLSFSGTTLNATAGSGTGLFVGRSGKTSAYTVVAGDKGYLIDCTSGTFSVSFDPAATLTSGFHVAVYNSGSGTITLDPNGSETIRDPSGSATTKSLAQGQGMILVCDGSGFVVASQAASGGGGGTPGGSDTEVQYNDGGAFGGDSGMTFNESTNVLTVTGRVVSGNGSASTPGFGFSGNSGMYATGGGSLQFANGGSFIFGYSLGSLTFGHDSQLDGITDIGDVPRYQYSSTGVHSMMGLFNWHNNSGVGAQLNFHRSKSGTIGMHTTLASGNEIGGMDFAGSDGIRFVPSAAIKVFVDNTVSNNAVPGRIAFYTMTGLTYNERARITSAGNLLIGTTSETGLTGSGNLKVNAEIETATITVNATNGTAIDLIVSAAATLDFPSIAANGGTQDLTITVTGASVGDVVYLGLPAAPDAGVVFNGWISATNTATIRATNTTTGGAIDPASATYRAAVMSF